ncbi:hypothetical protein CUS60_04230 [Enterococcus faecium]|nr:hypothetical protein CUS60_04230 [Enterococcus faecium]
MIQDYKRIQKILSDIGVNVTVQQAKDICEYYSKCYMSTELPTEDRTLYLKVVHIIKNLKPIGYVDKRPAYFNRIADQIDIHTSKIALEKILFLQNLIYYEIPNNESSYKRKVYFEYANSYILGLSIQPEERRIIFYLWYKGKEMLSEGMIENILILLERLWLGLKAYVDIDYGEFQEYKIERYYPLSNEQYIVCKHFGMDTSEKAIPYIATWTKNGQTLDDKEAAERGKIMNDVSRVANEFIQTISNEINQYREREPEIQPAEVKQDEKNVVETAEQKNIVPVGSLWIDKKDGKVLEEDTGRTLHLKDAAFIEDPQHNQVILKGKSYGKEIQTALPSEEFALGNPFRFSLETVSEVAKRKNEIYYEQQLSQKERV